MSVEWCFLENNPRHHLILKPSGPCLLLIRPCHLPEEQKELRPHSRLVAKLLLDPQQPWPFTNSTYCWLSKRLHFLEPGF